ncbi:magnesium transporter [Flocculibacter collagenilyticus]|uniref:magnesium transporter n=1 Tax=Flocculibacter collagenilyticus TaxID=2744479 RepID=UPI0018F47697|nr:magnesium transporter [Flocculibacter collagenilyticus]
MLEIASDQLSSVINDILNTEHDAQIADIIQPLQDSFAPEQFALLIEAVPPAQRLTVWHGLNEQNQRQAFVLSGKDTRTWLMDALSDDACFELLAQLDVEEVLELAEEIPDRFLNYAIKHLDEQQRQHYQQAQQYDDEHIGHWLDYDYVRISNKLKTSSAKRLLNKGITAYTDAFYAVNKEGKLIGELPLNALLAANDTDMLEQLIETDAVVLNATDNLSEAADAVILSGKMALPVIDEQGCFLGRVHIASAYQIKQELLDEQTAHAGGLSEDEDLFSSVRKSAKNRGIWLGINLATAFLASWFIGLFEATLQQVVALAVLMPVVASMGGISGSQTLTVIVRGLALGQITDANRKALLQKELKVGAVNGVIWSLVIGGITYLWFNQWELSIVISLAILLNLLAAAASGVLIPSILNRLKIDPALSGSVILTTVTDVVGFVVFLGLGSLVLL